MSTGLSAGSIWWRYVDFKDGKGPSKKYFVLLNDVLKPADHFIAAFTTSQGAKRYPGETSSQCGCPGLSCFRIEKGQEACFDLITWVQYDNLFEATPDILDQSRKSSMAGFVQMLEPNRTRSVMNCAMKSRDMTGRQVALVRQTLEAMNAKSAAQREAAKTAPKPAPAKPKSPIDVLREQLDGHQADCRDTFCALAEVSSTELVQILSGSKAAPEGFVETANAAIVLVTEECKCGGNKGA